MLYDSFDINVAKKVWREEAREEGFKEGFEEGFKEGFQIGVQETNRQIAKSLSDVLDIKIISDKTGLSIDEINLL